MWHIRHCHNLWYPQRAAMVSMWIFYGLTGSTYKKHTYTAGSYPATSCMLFNDFNYITDAHDFDDDGRYESVYHCLSQYLHRSILISEAWSFKNRCGYNKKYPSQKLHEIIFVCFDQENYNLYHHLLNNYSWDSGLDDWNFPHF